MKSLALMSVLKEVISWMQFFLAVKTLNNDKLSLAATNLLSLVFIF
jgi:hypothetical protein